jgi:hypothetical protein
LKVRGVREFESLSSSKSLNNEKKKLMNAKLIGKILVLIVLFSCEKKVDPEFVELKPNRKDKLILGKVEEIIPLETTKESFLDYVSKSYIDKKNDRIIVNADMNIFLFDAGGKFISKLKKGKGPGEVNLVVSFAVDSNNKRIYVIDMGNIIHIYDYDANFIETHKLSEFYSLDLHLIDKDNIFLYCSYVGRNEKHFVGIYNLTEKKVTKRFVSDKESPYSILCMGNASNFFEMENRLYFRSANIFGLFEFQADTFRRIITYRLGEKAVPESFYASYVEKRNRSTFGEDALKKGFVPYLKESFYFKNYFLAVLYDENSSCYAINSKNHKKVYFQGQLSEYFNLPKLKSLNSLCGIQDDFLTFSCLPIDFFEGAKVKERLVELGEEKLAVNYDDNPILIVVK